MKKFIIITLLILFISPKSFAAKSSFKTFTPTPNYYNNHYNNYRKYLPPPPPSVLNSNGNKFWKRRNPYNNNNYYNSYNNPYYYRPKQSVFSTIGDLFSSGKMTGYTDSDFNDTYTPYAYQEEYTDGNGNYYKNNYGYQNGASVKILD